MVSTTVLHARIALVSDRHMVKAEMLVVVLLAVALWQWIGAS